MNGAIWYYENREAAIEKLLDIKDKYNRIGVETVRSSISSYRNDCNITFDNGDYWRTIFAGSNSRGHKLNISYISRDIPYEIIRNIILPCTIAFPYQGFRLY